MGVDENKAVTPPPCARCSLLMRGAESPFPRETAERMAEVIPDCRLVEIADSGHFPNIDNPGAFLAAVRAFLTDLA